MNDKIKNKLEMEKPYADLTGDDLLQFLYCDEEYEVASDASGASDASDDSVSLFPTSPEDTESLDTSYKDIKGVRCY